MNEPLPQDPTWPRYATRPFPRYRYLPGHSPHPVRDPEGHSYGLEPPAREPLVLARWSDCEDYLHAIDLYNFNYWWECHEEFEIFWNELGRKGPPATLLQSLIQIAAANLKHDVGASAAAQSLARKGVAGLRSVSASWLGIDPLGLAHDAQAFFSGQRRKPARIRLQLL